LGGGDGSLSAGQRNRDPNDGLHALIASGLVEWHALHVMNTVANVVGSFAKLIVSLTLLWIAWKGVVLSESRNAFGPVETQISVAR
jgi:hypothetical protein